VATPRSSACHLLLIAAVDQPGQHCQALTAAAAAAAAAAALHGIVLQ
jgi:hypothetical protein